MGELIQLEVFSRLIVTSAVVDQMALLAVRENFAENQKQARIAQQMERLMQLEAISRSTVTFAAVDQMELLHAQGNFAQPNRQTQLAQ